MIDTFQKIAARIRPLRYAAIALGLACLAAVVFIVLASPPSGEQNRYLMPAMVGFIWALSAYGFIDTFQSVPVKAHRSRGFLARAGSCLHRGWFWLLALLFIVSTLAALLLTFKLGAFWLGKYG